MANILINGLNLSVGGGKNILDNYLQQLTSRTQIHHYYVLTPDYHHYKSFQKDRVTILTIAKPYQKNVFFLALYFSKFPRLLQKLKIDLVFNFGDVIIPTHVPQVYFFDWAYAVYSAPYIWKGMKVKDRLIRKTKVFLIDRYIKTVASTLCQTSNMAARLQQKYGITNLRIIPTPLGLSQHTLADINFNFPVGRKCFLYPAGYATHKNFEVILEIGKLIHQQQLPLAIVLTVDPVVAADFLRKVAANGLDCIFNVGKLSSDAMAGLYKKCDALLFPSLLESYGLPYIEAMAFEIPILTSDLDFSHAICGDAAVYFDPLDATDILTVMQHYDQDPEQMRVRIVKGKKIVSELPDWKTVFLQFEEQIEFILNQHNHAR